MGMISRTRSVCHPPKGWSWPPRREFVNIKSICGTSISPRTKRPDSQPAGHAHLGEELRKSDSPAGARAETHRHGEFLAQLVPLDALCALTHRGLFDLAVKPSAPRWASINRSARSRGGSVA